MKCLSFKSLICVVFAATTVGAQTNLLLNPNADSDTEKWRASGHATVEEFDGNKVFVVRNQGSFFQEVNLNKSDIGKFALLIGRASSERINADGAITGLPYLYGYMLNLKDERINTYLQGQQMRARPARKNEWVTIYGVFRVPENTGTIRFYLNQAERR